MNLIKVFKKLIIVNLLIILFFIVSPFTIPESLKVSYFNNSVEVADVYFLFVLLWILAFIVNMYLLYTFKNPGKQMYL